MTNLKNKLLLVLVIVFFIANAIAITMFFFWNGKQPPQDIGTPQQFLVKELGLDLKQQQQYDLLVKEHRETTNILRQNIRTSKSSFFDLLKQQYVSDSIKQVAAKAVSKYTEALDLITLNHFQKVRAICTIKQQERFDEIIKQVIDMISQPRPPGDSMPPMPFGSKDAPPPQPQN